MTVQVYQLRCECGETHELTTRQAGETLDCKCGKTLEIPTLRAMRHLPQVSSAAEVRTKRTWSRLQGSLFVTGLLLSLISGGVVANFGWKRSKLVTKPIAVEELEFARDIMILTPTQSWDAWSNAFRDEELGARNKPMHQIAQEFAKRWLVFIIAGAVGLAIGILAMITSLILK